MPSTPYIRVYRRESQALPATLDERVRAVGACVSHSRASSPCKRLPSHRHHRRPPRGQFAPTRHYAASPLLRRLVPIRNATSSPCILRPCSAALQPSIRPTACCRVGLHIRECASLFAHPIAGRQVVERIYLAGPTTQYRPR